MHAPDSHHHHHHAAEAPHPAESAPWSILRMGVAGRLAVALGVSATLWAAVLLAMR